MERNLKTYTDLMGHRDNFYPGITSDVLRMAVKDGIKRLRMSEEEYNTVCVYMIHSCAWNWDKKTFMGIEFVVEEKLR